MLEAREISEKKKETTVDELQEAFLRGRPFCYLLGEAEFYQHKFIINENVLIPRQETEFLVDLIVQKEKGRRPRILDVGTGSGVILCSLLLNGVGGQGIGIDISEKALDVARINARSLGLNDRLSLFQSDRLEKVEGYFDLIVSNPPYIKAQGHLSLVHPKVDEYEPHTALYLSDESYDLWFESFFLEVRSHLRGVFYMEGHELEVERQARLLENLGFTEVSVLSDLTGTPRFIRGVYKAQ